MVRRLDLVALLAGWVRDAEERCQQRAAGIRGGLRGGHRAPDWRQVRHEPRSPGLADRPGEFAFRDPQ